MAVVTTHSFKPCFFILSISRVLWNSCVELHGSAFGMWCHLLPQFLWI